MVFFFVIIVLGSIFVIKNNITKKPINSYEMLSKGYGENASKLSEQIQLTSFSGLEESGVTKSEQIYTSTNVESSSADKVSIPFFQTSNVEGLLAWISNAEEEDSCKHFLDVVRKKEEILVVEAKNKEFELESITVHPNYEYMTYTFKKDKNYICIIINLSDSMKKQMIDLENKKDIGDVISEYNKKLKNTYKDFQYCKGSAIIGKTKFDIFYNDGGYYEKINGEKVLISPGAFLEINGIEVEIALYANLKDVKWDNKYLDLFNFKMIKMK